VNREGLNIPCHVISPVFQCVWCRVLLSDYRSSPGDGTAYVTSTLHQVKHWYFCQLFGMGNSASISSVLKR